MSYRYTYEEKELKILVLPADTGKLFLFNNPLNALSFSIYQGLS